MAIKSFAKLRLSLSMCLSRSGLCALTALYCLTGYGDDITTESSGGIGYRCQLGDVIRRVEIHYPQSPKTLPCEVIYHRDTELPNSPEILWRANNDGSYCEKQADAMIGRLTTLWGWKCKAQ